MSNWFYSASLAARARGLVLTLAAAAPLAGCAGLLGAPPQHNLGAAEVRWGSLKDEMPQPAAYAPQPAPQPAPGRSPPGPLPAPGRRGPSSPSTGPAAAPAGCGSDAECLARLKALLEDPQRSWIGQRQPALEFATGVRLFAYHALRGRLACSELSLALAELDAQGRAFRQPVRGVTPDQAERVRALNAEVATELAAEHAARCRS